MNRFLYNFKSCITFRRRNYVNIKLSIATWKIFHFFRIIIQFNVHCWYMTFLNVLHFTCVHHRHAYKGWGDIIPNLSLSGGVKTPPRPLNSGLVWKVNSLTLPPAVGGGWINPKGWQYVFFLFGLLPPPHQLFYCTALGAGLGSSAAMSVCFSSSLYLYSRQVTKK